MGNGIISELSTGQGVWGVQGSTIASLLMFNYLSTYEYVYKVSFLYEFYKFKINK